MNWKFYGLPLFIFILYTSAPLDAAHQLSVSSKELLYPQISLVKYYVNSFNQVHTELEKFNIRLNRYYETVPSDSASRVAWELRKGKLTFSLPPAKGQSRSGELTPEQHYRKALDLSRKLNVSNQEELIDELKNLHRLHGQLQHLTRNLMHSVRTRSYLKEPDLHSLYQLLKSCAVLFEDMNTSKGKFYFELEVAELKLNSQESRSPYVAPAHQLAQLVEDCRALLLSLKTGNLKTVHAKNKVLKENIAFCERQKDDFLGALSGRQESSKNPSYRYQQVIDKARELEHMATQYLNKSPVPTSYKKQGRGYYFYNYRQLPTFNKPGQGLVAQYNRFLSLGEVPSLPKVGELNWLKLVIPPPKGGLHKKGSGPSHLVFLIDVSGSMRQPEKLPTIKQTFSHLINQLSARDKITLISFADTALVLTSAATVQQRGKLAQGISRLVAEGEITGMAGFELAYREAVEHFIPDGNNQVILVSDGGFPIPRPLPSLIEEHGYKGISLSAWYTGNEIEKVKARFTTLTRIGKGFYTAIPSETDVNLVVEAIIGK